MSLSSPEWKFIPVTPDYTGPTYKMNREKWVTKELDGTLILTFEEADSLLFNGDTNVGYRGIPRTHEEGYAHFFVRSDRDLRFSFEVSQKFITSKRLEIRFKPVGYSSMGSYPVVVEESDETCPICFEEYRIGDTIAETICKHRYHFDCLKKILRRECPCCRQSLNLV
jgi:hypothetical protein